MLYKTLKNEMYKADRGILLYIQEGRYIIRLVKFGNEIQFFSRDAFESWLTSDKCFLYTAIKKAA